MKQQVKGQWTATTPRRLFAVLLSALMPGVGQIMLGRRGWALFWVGVPLAAMLLVPTLGIKAVLFSYVCRLGSSVHAALMKTGGPAPDTVGKTAVFSVLLVLGYFAVVTQIGHDVYDSTTMVDANMYPALEAGDYAVVDKTAYGWRVPFVGRVKQKPVAVGDVVAVDNPDKPDDAWIGRVLARGPVSFEMKAGQVVVGGVPVERVAQADAACAFVDPSAEKRELVDVPCARFEEKLGGRTWASVQPKDGAPPSTQQVRQLAAGQILVVADNRRGIAPWKIVGEDAVRGRVASIWFSQKGPRGIAWDRVDLPIK
jgi:hypothetical protein